MLFPSPLYVLHEHTWLSRYREILARGNTNLVPWHLSVASYLVLVQRFPSPSRSIHFGDVSETGGKRPHIFAWVTWTETLWPREILRPRDQAMLPRENGNRDRSERLGEIQVQWITRFVFLIPLSDAHLSTDSRYSIINVIESSCARGCQVRWFLSFSTNKWRKVWHMWQDKRRRGKIRICYGD